MRLLLALLLALPMFVMSGCNDGYVEPATEAGNDPPVEQQVNWMEESRKRGSGPKTKGKPGATAPKTAEPAKK